MTGKHYKTNKVLLAKSTKTTDDLNLTKSCLQTKRNDLHAMNHEIWTSQRAPINLQHFTKVEPDMLEAY